MMTWNVLWMAAVAAAAALAGFCMGRLSMQMMEGMPGDEGGEGVGQRKGVWEVEAAGEWNMQLNVGTLEQSGEKPRIRMADHMSRDNVTKKDTTEQVAARDRGVRTGAVDRTDGKTGDSFRSGVAGKWSGGLESVRRSTDSRSLRTGRRVHRGRDQQSTKGFGRVVGSPVTGLVVSYREGEHPAVVLSPLEDKLYAPANGKVIKLFPMGNAFLFRTEFGTELYIQAGDVKDDLLGRYFRPRVVQNEVVNKGKLLLEFDRLGLKAEGTSFAVTVGVESRTYGSNVTMTAKEQVRPGEEIMRVQEKYFPESNFMEKS